MIQDTAPPAPPARAAPRRTPFADLGSWTAFAAFVIVAWEIGSRVYNQPYLLPAPSQIITALREDAPLVLYYAGITTQETVLGFVASSGVALLGAMLLVWLHRGVGKFLDRGVLTD